MSRIMSQARESLRRAQKFCGNIRFGVMAKATAPSGAVARNVVECDDAGAALLEAGRDGIRPVPLLRRGPWSTK